MKFIVGICALGLYMTGALAAPQATEAELEAIRRLTPRHQSATCAELEALLPTPTESLARIAEHAVTPPWIAGSIGFPISMSL